MLRWLGVDIRASRKHEQRSPQLFPAFLQDMRHLKGIEISNAVDAGIGAAIMEHPNLAILHVHGRMPLASKSLPISTIALANLQELKLEFVGLPRETVRAMLLASSNLTIFEISLDLP